MHFKNIITAKFVFKTKENNTVEKLTSYDVSFSTLSRHRRDEKILNNFCSSLLKMKKILLHGDKWGHNYRFDKGSSHFHSLKIFIQVLL